MPNTKTEAPLLELNDITFAYTNQPALFANLCLTLHKHEQIGLYGPNGSGKTTLLRLIMGLETAQKGKILFKGNPIKEAADLYNLRCRMGFVLQNSDDQLFLPTVLEDVAFGPLNLGLKRTQARDRAMETLINLGLADYAERQTHRLSGGEKKMVAIASVLSMQPEALLLDEPTAFLDEESKNKIIKVLQQQNIAKIVVAHDKDFLEQTTQTIRYINDGTIK